jgi:hypothetical protein
MIGDDRRRFCRECRKAVTDLSAMTDGEARDFLAANPGSCVRYTRNTSGAVAHKAPCETVARRIARRRAGALVALGTALWSTAAIAAPEADQAPGWWTWVETRVHEIAQKVGIVAAPVEVPPLMGAVAYVPPPPADPPPVVMGKVARAQAAEETVK